MNKFDLALVSDFYEFTMSNVYFENGMTDQISPVNLKLDK